MLINKTLLGCTQTEGRDRPSSWICSPLIGLWKFATSTLEMTTCSPQFTIGHLTIVKLQGTQKVTHNLSLKLWLLHYPCSHVIIFQELRNLFTLITSCQAPHNHLIAICNVLCWLTQKVNREASREGCNLLLPVERFPLPYMHWGRWGNGSCGELEKEAGIVKIQTSFLQLSTCVPFSVQRGWIPKIWVLFLQLSDMKAQDYTRSYN